MFRVAAFRDLFELFLTSFTAKGVSALLALFTTAHTAPMPVIAAKK